MRGLLRVVDRDFLMAAAPTAAVWATALIRGGRPRLWPYLVASFWAGVWGVWWLMAQQMILAFLLGVLVGWATLARVRRAVARARRGAAMALVRWAQEIDPQTGSGCA